MRKPKTFIKMIAGVRSKKEKKEVKSIRKKALEVIRKSYIKYDIRDATYDAIVRYIESSQRTYDDIKEAIDLIKEIKSDITKKVLDDARKMRIRVQKEKEEEEERIHKKLHEIAQKRKERIVKEKIREYAMKKRYQKKIHIFTREYIRSLTSSNRADAYAIRKLIINHLPHGKTYYVCIYKKDKGTGKESFEIVNFVHNSTSEEVAMIEHVYNIPMDHIHQWWDDNAIFWDWKFNSEKWLLEFETYEKNEEEEEKILESLFEEDENEEDEYEKIEKLGQDRYDVKVVFTEAEVPNRFDHHQSFLDGQEHCFFNPIRNYFNVLIKHDISKKKNEEYKYILSRIDQFEEKYKKGIPKTEIQQICDELKIAVKVVLPFDIPIVECTVRNPRKTFLFMNTRFNHLDIINNVFECNRQIEKITIENDEMIRIFTERKSNNEFMLYTPMNRLGEIRYIMTTQKEYYLKDECKEYFDIFNEKYDFNQFSIDAIQNPDLVEFIKAGVHYNTCYDLHRDDVEKYQKIKLNEVNKILIYYDMVKAYTQFKSYSKYIGFLGKITDFRTLYNIPMTFALENIGMYRITNIQFPAGKLNELNRKINIYVNEAIYTTPELIFLYNNGVSFELIDGCWGTSFDFEFDEVMTNTKKIYKLADGKEKKASYYSLWSGMQDSLKYSKSFELIGNKEYTEIFHYHAGKQNMMVQKGYNRDSMTISVSKKYVSYKGQITAYITAYQRLNMIEQMMKMNIDNIVRIITDGIFYIKDDEKIEIHDMFDVKVIESINAGGDTYLSNLYATPKGASTPLNMDYYTKRVNLFEGQGGSGKTTIAMKDDGYINKLYVCPSYKLRANMKTNYDQIDGEVLANLFDHVYKKGGEKYTSELMIKKVNKIKRFYNVLLLDECSQYSEECKKYLIETFKYHKLIFIGDIGYQLPSPHGTPINHDGFEVIIKFKGTHRFLCEKMIELNKALRKGISLDTSKILHVLKMKYPEMFIKVEDVEKTYQINDYILTSKIRCNEHHDEKCNCDGKNHTFEWTERFKGKFGEVEKYRIYQNSDDYHNGDVLINNEQPKHSIISHAFTIHGIQGETIENDKIFIDLRSLFDNRMLYTAVSRARRIDQIKFIEFF